MSLTRCCFDVGPASQTVGNIKKGISSRFRDSRVSICLGIPAENLTVPALVMTGEAIGEIH